VFPAVSDGKQGWRFQFTGADMPSDAHLEGQIRILASQPAFLLKVRISTNGVTSMLEFLISHTLH